MTSTQCMYIHTIPSLSYTITVYIMCTSVCYTQTRTCNIYTHKPRAWMPPATAHSGTQTLSVELPSNSSLRHMYTHKPRVWMPPATAHSGTQTLSVELPQQQLTQAHIYTQTLSVGQLQQQLTQAHIYTQTQVWSDSSNSSLRYTQTHYTHIHNYTDIQTTLSGAAPATAHLDTHKHINR